MSITVRESGSDININNLLAVLKKSGKNYDTEKIERAFEYAREIHDGQFRNSGEPYIVHPIAVAEIVAGLGLDTDSICAAFLHDTIEDCPDKTNYDEIKRRFGDSVAMLVDGLTKMNDINIVDKEEAHMENIRKMLLAMSKDIRVIFIKLCDRLHNMRTLDAKPENKRRVTALETMHVYAPLAHRLGMQRIKQELENLALAYLDPIGYQEISNYIEDKYGKNRDFIQKVREYISAKLDEYEINYTLEGRVKTVYSIYRKIYNQNKSFDEIYDFYALRIIVDTELECYTALGIIHELYKSVPGRFKDYISTPKPNMYQSLHTTVIGRDGIPFEVQIRTKEMHHVAEYGVAAHWKYKSGEQSRADIDEKLQWISKLIDVENDTIDPDDFMHALKIDIFHDETFVFTPKGDVIALPQGSTIIDFAYAIHSEVGHKMIGAKINGMIAPIDRVPQNGEIVEIITSQSSEGPSRDWLKIVKTGEARNKIRQWFKKEKRSENIVIGRADIENEILRCGKRATKAQKAEIITNVAKRLGFQEADDLCNTVGYGGLAVSKLSAKLKDEYDRIVKVADAADGVNDEDQLVAKAPKNIRSDSGIILDGESGYAIKFAKCCNPLPGDKVIGFVTKGYGVSIHKRDCPNVIEGMKKEEFFQRWIPATWDPSVIKDKQGVYEAILRLVYENRIGLLAEISAMLADMRVSITQLNTRSSSNGEMILNMGIACKNIDHYDSIVSRLKTVKGVVSVTRGFN
ncbi:MAG: bifunctional (p)ppGpp synthetase/guanosine-3',5'-bis(diphosphate) 3'-pyrophosphohydrolase [Clostridia bacterium]|nr:bifunctional (p)ppGpp synthetase/guanosine-3',5'-bis(diphosphate) 3'-pyrophosphohydrolase [Clostridia bacterium]